LADAQHLPQGRSQAGDRHLNSHETRDNLVAGTRLRYQFYGSPRRCTDYDGAELATSRTAVVIKPHARNKTGGTGNQLLYAERREVWVNLLAPLGSRVLIDTGGQPIQARTRSH